MLRSRILFGIIPMIFLYSCATVLGGKKNSIVMGRHVPTNAGIYLDGNQIGTGPGKYKLSKGVILPGSSLHVKSGNDTILNQELDLEAHPAYLAGDFLLLGLGLIVDVPTGNIYRPKPRKFFTRDDQ